MSGEQSPIIWLALTSQAQKDALSQALGAFGLPVERMLSAGEGPAVAMLVIDAAHTHVADAARARAGEAMQIILIGNDDLLRARADFILDADVETDRIVSACAAALDMRRRRIEFQHDVGKRRSAIGTIMSGSFVIRTLEEARNLSTMLALACPHPDLTALGLQELLVNAIEHGNLEISSDAKQQLLLSGAWRDEVERRLADPRFGNRAVIVTFDRKVQRIEVTIEDEGEGFDFEAWMAARDPQSSTYHGRGIALAREIAFAEIAYLGRGNRVRATIRVPDPTSP
jgi:sigma-B regulation protein RsbU (phosphoserine phosphatase)